MKRKLQEASTAEVPASSASAPKRKSKGKQVKRQKSTANANKLDIVWPEHFNSVNTESIHRVLNLTLLKLFKVDPPLF